MSDTFNEFINQCWGDHADKAEEVAQRLKDYVAKIESQENVPGFVAIATHTFGGHLGKWDEGIEVLTQVKNKFPHEAIDRGVATLSYCAENNALFETSLLGLKEEGSDVRVYAMAASELAAQGNSTRAMESFSKALELVPDSITKDYPATRSLAISGNNLACDLEEKESRSDDEVKLMILAAQTGRKFWELAGTWENVERAEYRLSQSFLKAGDFEKAIFHANECKRICVENDALPMEHFFAHEALAKIQLELCRQWKDKVKPEYQKYCTVPS